MRAARAFVILSVFGLLGADEAKKDDGGDLKGDWTIVAMKLGERTAPADLIKNLSTNFDGQGYTNKANDVVVEQGTYRVDAGKTPMTIDFAIKKGPDAGKAQLGIYRLDGETLTLCVGEAGSDKRPATLETPAGGTAMTIVLKRAKR